MRIRWHASAIGVLALSLPLLVGTGCASDGPTEPALGLVRVIVRTTGGDPDTGYEVLVGTQRLGIGANASVAFSLPLGEQHVELADIADNCSIDGSASMTVTVHARDTTVASFNISCFATGVEVTTVTSGFDLPVSYGVEVVGVTVSKMAASGSIQVTRLLPGTYTVDLDAIASNCHVAGDAERKVTVTNRNVTPVKFEVLCAPIVRLEKIVFVLDTLSGASAVAELSTANPDGSGQARITVGNSPAWSPDGKRFAYTNTSCSYYYYYCSNILAVIDPETGSYTEVRGTSSALTPAWSPDGSLIAYSDGGNGLLRITSPDGNSNVIVPLSGAPRTQDPAWSPDGQTLAFTCIVAGKPQRICSAKRDGSQLVTLTPDSFISLNPDWSHDGKRIAFEVVMPGSSRGIAVMDADGNSLTRLTDGFDPAWSRDGSKIVFARDDGLFTIDADGTNLVRLTTGKHREPAWRP